VRCAGRSIGATTVALVLAVTSFVLAACSDEGEDERPAPSAVTEAEYRAAVEATRDCVAEAGVPVGEIEQGGTRLVFSFGGGEEDKGDRASEVHRRCFAEHGLAATEAWLAANAPTAEEEHATNDAIVGCLRDRGHQIDGPVSPELVAGLRRLGQDWVDCAAPLLR
jgi:hypothetical protein